MTVSHRFRHFITVSRAAVLAAVLASLLIGCESRSTVPSGETQPDERRPEATRSDAAQPVLPRSGAPSSGDVAAEPESATGGQREGGQREGGQREGGQRNFSSAPRTLREVEPGFTPLYLADFLLFAPKTEKGTLDVSESGDVIRLAGDQRAYLHTQKPYHDFTLRLDYRFPEADAMTEDGNTGVLLFITGEHRIWPRCLEVQGKWSEIGHIKSNARDVTVTVNDDQAAREQSRKPLGEWNSLEIIARNGAVESFLNGTRIASSEPTALVEGPVALQAERDVVEFRNVRIQSAEK